ncbi:serine/threonine-protein phosphatase 6 regulatory ankyrin repeat subunit A-like, partial [Uloborus diversus]|uniref:serine/threonine-protein phosphatase 6 regulatory ankyrin repeat subunit A-like n=1 Tax=Uloborus diversus TaxID=327109 RepID=UPI0024090F64
MNSGDGCGANRELPSTSKRQSEDSEKEPPRKRVEACHDASGEMKLHRAVRCSDRCATLAISTAEPKDLGMQDERGRTALHEAVWCGSTEVVKMLLAAWSSSHLGATHPLLEIQDDEGNTALHLAVYCGPLEMVEVLLAARTDINPRDANGRKPLVDIQNECGRTALHEAACGYSTEMVAMLLAAGANTHLQDKWGQTALHVAISSQNFCLRDLFRKTLRSGKESTSNAAEREGIALSASEEDLVDARDKYGMTALHHAAKYGFTEIVELLLAAGTDPLLQTKEGKTALHVAIDCYREDIAEILCGAEDGNHLQDKYGRTALHYAASRKSKRTVRNLLFNGEHPHTIDKGGSSPLQLAFVDSGDNSVAEMIISFIALKDISVDWKGWNARRVEICKKRMEECVSEIRRMKETKVLSRNITYYDVAARHVGRHVISQASSENSAQLAKSVNVLNAIQWITKAVSSISKSCVQNCFKKAGFKIQGVIVNESNNEENELSELARVTGCDIPINDYIAIDENLCTDDTNEDITAFISEKIEDAGGSLPEDLESSEEEEEPEEDCKIKNY